MSLLAAYAATQNENFQRRVTAGVFRVAQDVLNEESQELTPRRLLARRIFEDPTRWANSFIWPTASNPTVESKVHEKTGECTAEDNDLLWVISSIWDLLAAQGF